MISIFIGFAFHSLIFPLLHPSMAFTQLHGPFLFNLHVSTCHACNVQQARLILFSCRPPPSKAPNPPPTTHPHTALHTHTQGPGQRAAAGGIQGKSKNNPDPREAFSFTFPLFKIDFWVPEKQYLQKYQNFTIILWGEKPQNSLGGLGSEKHQEHNPS